MRTVSALICVSALSAVTAHNQASAEPTHTQLALMARARLMCDISSYGPVRITQEGLSLGTVREHCNSGQGYQINVQFTNVAGGVLEIGAQRYPIPANGRIILESPGPRLRITAWRVRAPVLSSNGETPRMALLLSPVRS